jgi:hypothetical protein
VIVHAGIVAVAILREYEAKARYLPFVIEDAPVRP